MSHPNFIKQPSDFKAEKTIAGLYDLGDPIGEGNFSVVREAKHVFTGETVAVKIINKDKIPPIQRETITQEARCMQLVEHPYIVRLLEVFDTPTKLYLVMECADGGDLHEYVSKQISQNGLSDRVAKRFFAQIVQAVAYCHQMCVVHRDLKPENIVVFKKLNVVKLTDFGFSRKFEPGVPLYNACGSLAYSAPEIFVKESYDPVPVDVWSLGVILYWMVCGKSPFTGANDSETLIRILDCKFTQPPANVSADCRHLINMLLRKHPKNRGTLMDIINHRWLTDELSASSCESLLIKDHISPSDHTQIVNVMIEGKVATRSEIFASLEQRKNNHITATYFLLAGRIGQKPNYYGLDAEPDIKRQNSRNIAEQPSTILTSSLSSRSDSNFCSGKLVNRVFSIIREESFASMSLDMRSMKCISHSQSLGNVTDLIEQLHDSESFSGFSHTVLSPTLRRKGSSEIKSKTSGTTRNPLLQLKEDTDESEIQSDAHRVLSDDDCAKTGTCKISKKFSLPRFTPTDTVSAEEQKPKELHIEDSEVKCTTQKDVTPDAPLPEKQDEESVTQTLQLDEKDGCSKEKQKRFRTKIVPCFIDVVQPSDACGCCNRKPCTCCATQ